MQGLYAIQNTPLLKSGLKKKATMAPISKLPAPKLPKARKASIKSFTIPSPKKTTILKVVQSEVVKEGVARKTRGGDKLRFHKGSNLGLQASKSSEDLFVLDSLILLYNY